MHPLLPATQEVVASPTGFSGILVLLVAISFDTFVFWILWFLFTAHAISLCRWTPNDDISRSPLSSAILADAATTVA